MIAKALEEIVKRLVDRITTAKFGWPLLVLFALLAGAYLGVSQLRSAPETVAILQDSLFQTCALLSVSGTLLYISWMAKRGPRWRVLAMISVICIATPVIWWNYIRDQTIYLRLDIALDADLQISNAELETILGDLQQPHITATLLSDRVSLTDSVALDFRDAESIFLPRVRPKTKATQTIFVTNKLLSGAGWSNLFYVNSPRFAVLATVGLTEASSRDLNILRRKYFAAMIPLIALHGLAMAESKTLLADRDSRTDHGCLHDFGVNKSLMLARIERGPKLCVMEESEISQALGPTLVAEYKAILARAAANAP